MLPVAVEDDSLSAAVWTVVVLGPLQLQTGYPQLRSFIFFALSNYYETRAILSTKRILPLEGRLKR